MITLKYILNMLKFYVKYLLNTLWTYYKFIQAILAHFLKYYKSQFLIVVLIILYISIAL